MLKRAGRHRGARMVTLALALLLAQTPQHRLFLQPNLPQGASYAFFEAFPASGAGTSGACSATAPTGAKGEALTFTRGSTATCTKTATGGLATTGIADGDLVELSSNVARVEYDSAGTLGLLVESSRANVLPRFIDYTNAAWSDVGTPTLTGSQVSPFAGTYATSAVTFSDNDAAAYEGRSQPVTVAAGAAYTMHCYVKGGTATSARLLLDGTAATVTGLATDSWSIVQVTDASSSGVSISAQVMVGDATTVTGTVTVGGCQVEAGSYRTSITPTVVTAVTRSADSAAFTIPALSSANGLSWAATVTHPSANGGGVWAAGPNLVQDASNRTQLYRINTNVQQCDYFSTSGNRSVGPVIAVYVAGQSYRQACSYSGAGASSTLSGYRDGVLTGTSAAGLTSAWSATTIIPCALGAAATTAPADGICSRICADPTEARCR